MSLAELWSAGAHKQHEYRMWVDRGGDRANVDYGHPFKLDIPSYRVTRRILPPMGLENRTIIALQEGGREGHVPPQLPQRRRAGRVPPREGWTRHPPVPTVGVVASRRGGPSGTTRAPHSGDGE